MENNVSETECDEIIRTLQKSIKRCNNGSIEDLYRQIYLIVEGI